jgi:uncharacterized membrane protein HdeD (DUF308 family)
MWLLRGLALLLLGFVAIAWPGLTLATLALFFTASLLVAGIVNIMTAITQMSSQRYWFLSLALGIIEIGFGVYVLKNPGLTISTFVLVIGFAILLRGILEGIAAFEDSYQGSTRMLMLVMGALAVIAGFMILRYSPASGLAFTWILGVYALVSGAIILALSVEARRFITMLEVAPAGKR